MHCQWKNAPWIKFVSFTTGRILGRSTVPSAKRAVRWYTVQPPDWLGGKNKLIISGKFDFPEHSQTFEEKMRSKYLFLSLVDLVGVTCRVRKIDYVLLRNFDF